MRCALSVAWFSAYGFHQTSKWITISALVKFKPVPPDFKVIRKQLVLSLSTTRLSFIMCHSGIDIAL